MMETNRLLSLRTKLTPWVGAACFSCSTEDGMLGHSSTNGREVVVRGYTQAGSWRTLGDNGRQWCFQKIKIISVCCLFSVHAHRFSVAQSCTRESRAVKGLGSDSGCNMWRRPWPVEAQSGTGHQPTYNKGRLGPGLGCNIGSMLVWNACSTLAIWGMRPGLPSWPPEPIKMLKHISA